MSIAEVGALVLFLFPLAYSPGSGNMLFAVNGANFGFRSAVGALIGYHVATWFVTIAISFGFSLALDKFPRLYLIIKIAGSLYVLWLAWKLIRSGVLKSQRQPKPAQCWDGVILLLLNPKAYFIIAVMFSQFLRPAGESQVLRIVAISTFFTLNNLVAFSLWTLIGDHLARQFRQAESARFLNTLFGALLAMVAIWMLFI